MEIKGIAPNALPLVHPQLPALSGSGRQGATPAAAKKVAREFEAMFVTMMLKSMRDTVGKDQLTGGGHGEETFRSLLDQEYATAATQGGGIGLAKMIEKELVRSNPQAAVPLKGNTDAD